MLSLQKSLRLPESSRIAFVGAGGKTTAIFSLARQIPPPVIVTTTTHLGSWELGLADYVLILDECDQIESIDIENFKGVTLIVGPSGDDHRHNGFSEKKIKKLIDQIGSQRITILIEADGSRKRPLKAPAEYEPVIPDNVDMVIVVAGMSALWKSLSDQTVHRPESYSKISGISPGEQITPAAIVNVLGHPSGGLKNIPKQARRILLLNQSDTAPLQLIAQEIAESLLTSYECVIVGSLNPEGNPEKDIAEMQSKEKKYLDVPALCWLGSERIISVHENIAGIILAAGESIRFGSPKQLIDWKGEPLIKHIVRRALGTGLSKILVITGAHTEEISNEINTLPVVQIHNPEWSEGQSSSIRIAINELRGNTNGAIFILADQPYLSSELIQALRSTHNVTLAPIIAPIVDNQRGNPVFFDRSTFSELLKLSGNQGGREVFDRFPIQFLEWNDPNILVDIDTMDDYLRLKSKWDEN